MAISLTDFFRESISPYLAIISQTASGSQLLKPVVTISGTTVNSDYQTSPNFTGSQTASNWYIFNPDGTLFSQDLNSPALSSYVPSGLPAGASHLISKENISGDFKSPMSDQVFFSTANEYILSPAFTIQQDNGKAVNMADITMSTLPLAHGCTISRVEYRVARTSDNVVIDSGFTTTLGLPIVFESRNLVQNTEYRWEVRCRDTSIHVISPWSSITLFTVNSFSTLSVFDIFRDASRVALFPFDNNVNDLGGQYNGRWHGSPSYQALKFGNGIRTTHRNNYVSIPNLGRAFSAASWSVAGWVNFTGITRQGIGHILSVGFSTHNNPFYVFALGTSSSTSAYATVKGYTNTMPFAVPTGITHVAVSVNGSTATLYLNGASAGSLSGLPNIVATNPTFSIGRLTNVNSASNASTFFVDHLSVFNRALTQVEVTQLFQEQ